MFNLREIVVESQRKVQSRLRKCAGFPKGKGFCPNKKTFTISLKEKLIKPFQEHAHLRQRSMDSLTPRASRAGRPIQRLKYASYSGCPTLAMLWIKEVEVAKSVYDLLTSGPLKGMYSLTLRCLMHRLRLRRRGSSRISTSNGELKWKSSMLPKHDRFLRGRQIAYMICEHFRATGAREAAPDLSDPCSVSLQGGDIQDFDSRWDQALSSASEILKANVLECVCNMRVRESVQLRELVAMYEQEIDRDGAMPGCQD